MTLISNEAIDVAGLLTVSSSPREIRLIGEEGCGRGGGEAARGNRLIDPPPRALPVRRLAFPEPPCT